MLAWISSGRQSSLPLYLVGAAGAPAMPNTDGSAHTTMREYLQYCARTYSTRASSCTPRSIGPADLRPKRNPYRTNAVMLVVPRDYGQPRLFLEHHCVNDRVRKASGGGAVRRGDTLRECTGRLYSCQGWGPLRTFGQVMPLAAAQCHEAALTLQ